MRPRQREALKTSMALMRRLLMDAQAKFRKMVEDNKQLATHIDGDIQTAHEEMNLLRAELADTNRRIDEMSTSVCQPQPPQSSSSVNVNHRVNSANQNDQPSDVMATNIGLSTDKCQSCRRHSCENQVQENLVTELKKENDRLGQHNRSLQREVEELRSVKERMVNDENEFRPTIIKLESELQQAKDALNALKADRKRLKAEKFDLLNQMKQLYGTLEDKEKELRDFIRTYEHKVQETNPGLPQKATSSELVNGDQENRWSTDLNADDTIVNRLRQKESQILLLQEELAETRRQLSQIGYCSDRDSPTGGVNGYHSPTQATTPVGYAHNGRDSVLGEAVYAPKGQVLTDEQSSIYSNTVGGSPSLLNVYPVGLSRSAEELSHMLSNLDLKKPKVEVGVGTYRRSNTKGTWGSISKVFSRNKSRRSMDQGLVTSVEKRTSWSPHNSLCASPLTEETYTEKIRLLEEAQTMHAECWKAATVLAWLEVTMGMPQYGPLCADNIKSGKVLLELNDAELEAGLGITNPMHRRKLRLAIEELRDPQTCKYPKICELNHLWVCNEWLPALGLSQYVDTFALHLVDARMLDNLTKKDLEKYLGVTRKFHQVSINHGIQLLRMVGYDRHILTDRRSMCEQVDGDPLVWTNHRFIHWARGIDLAEYADNLRDSGVHGALVVLEPSFMADTMATALGIPQSKNIIRRHLTTELESLVHPARVLLEQEYFGSRQLTKKEKHLMGSLGRSFSHSYTGGLGPSKGPLHDGRRSSLRGSLTRVLGLKVKQDLQQNSLSSASAIYGSGSLPPASPLAMQAGSTQSPHHSIYGSTSPYSRSNLSSQYQQQHYGYVSSNIGHNLRATSPLPRPTSSSSSTSSSATMPSSSATAPLQQHQLPSTASGSSGGSAVNVTPGISSSVTSGVTSTRSTPTPTAMAAHVDTHRRVKSSGDIEAITVTSV
ncbi:hypothetical protein CHUAL_000871 [Chamberlinius hualienensis]